MTSRKTSEIYDTTCHVQDADTVIVQGARFVRERTCKDLKEYPNLFTCSACGETQYERLDPSYCPNCGARVVEVDE